MTAPAAMACKIVGAASGLAGTGLSVSVLNLSRLFFEVAELFEVSCEVLCGFIPNTCPHKTVKLRSAVRMHTHTHRRTYKRTYIHTYIDICTHAFI